MNKPDIKKELETLAESGKEAFANGIMRMTVGCVDAEGHVDLDKLGIILASAIDVSEKYAEVTEVMLSEDEDKALWKALETSTKLIDKGRIEP